MDYHSPEHTQEALARLKSRRHWLAQFGGAIGLSTLPFLPSIARGSAPGELKPIRSCIFLFLYGGPSHFESFDPKPNAPREVRGEFGSISTSVPGVRLGENLPKLAAHAHRFGIIRSMHHQMRFHDSASSHTLTGRAPLTGDRETFPDTPQTFPSHGAGLSYMWREKKLPVCHAALPFVMNNEIRNPGQTPGMLGARYAPLQIEVDPQAKRYRADALRKPDGMDDARLADRWSMVSGLNTGVSPGAGRLIPLYERALALSASKAVHDALDLEREPLSVRERYGTPEQDRTDLPNARSRDGVGRNMRGQSVLAARRLVEAGVPFVSVYDFKQQGQNWDTHEKNFVQHKEVLLPPIDKAVSALIEDLQERGLLDETLIVVTGEFGRTPKINKDAGRDHWPDCYSTLLAGGGIQPGAIWGASDKLGAYPAVDPVTPGDLAATIFWRFGLDPATELHDGTGRPMKLADGQPLKGMFGVT